MRDALRRLVFMHIPKCAGSSIVSAAKSYLGSERSGNVVLLDDFMPAEQRREQIARAQDALFVSGHFGFETLEKVRKDAYVFTILREPYERLRSTYGYMTVLKEKNPLPEHLKRLSIEAFFSSTEDAVLQWTDNVIARAMAQTCDRSQSTFRDVDTMTAAAIANMGAFDHIGFLDTLDDDLTTIAKAARIATFAKLGHRNSTKSHLGESGRPEATAPLDDALRTRASALVAGDLRVYEAARRFVAHRNDAAPSHAAQPA